MDLLDSMRKELERLDRKFNAGTDTGFDLPDSMEFQVDNGEHITVNLEYKKGELND
jgi:hypothetical protein